MLSDLALPEELKRDISLASEILIENGCKEVYVFGSIANGSYSADSDIDLAAVGLPKSRFFSAYGRIISRVHRHVDLVGLDYNTDFGDMLKQSGNLSRVA
jgi:uncharacterized protein